jgi:hypothetical protein
MTGYKRRFITSGLVLALMFVFGFLPGTAFAAETPGPRESITLSPVKERFSVDAGGVKTGEITIVNDGETAYDFIMYSRPYSIGAQDETYANPNFTTQTPTTDAYQWVQFDKARYHIEAGKTLKINYTIRVPQDAAPGGHYGVIFAETQPEQTTAGNSVVRKKRVGMIIYATVNGQYQMGAQHLGTNIPFMQFRNPLTASTRIQNTGNSDFFVSTVYRVTDVFGNQKFRADQDFAVLPKTTRQITFNWDNAPWFGLFKAEVKASFLDQEKTQSGYVLLAPRWLLVVLALTAVGGVVYVVLRRKR